MSAKNAYDFSFRAIDGGALPLSTFKGKALLVVNVASQCGLTPQYAGLEALWTANRDKGLVVLGVPANDFGAQEPGTENEIKNFCETRFHVDFPMTAKEHVIGPNAHPLYKWVAGELGRGRRAQMELPQIFVRPRRRYRRHFRLAHAARGQRTRDRHQGRAGKLTRVRLYAIQGPEPEVASRESAMSETHRITVDPNQCGGRPCLRGLRIRVKDVLDLLAAGATREEILEDYPSLEPEDITAALEYAARQSDHPVLRVA